MSGACGFLLRPLSHLCTGSAGAPARCGKDKTAFWIASISARLASSCSDISSSYVIRFTMVLPIGSPAPGLRLEPSFSGISGNWALLFSLVIRSRCFSVCIHVEYLLLMVFMYFLHIIQVTLIFQLFARNFCVISSIWMRKNSFFHIHSKDTKIGILCADRLIFTRFYSFPTRINAKKPTLHRNARWANSLFDWMIDWIADFAKKRKTD